MPAVMIAQVAVEQTAIYFDKGYDYLVPPSMQETALPGCRVLVPFGRGNRKRRESCCRFGRKRHWNPSNRLQRCLTRRRFFQMSFFLWESGLGKRPIVLSSTRSRPCCRRE